MTPFIQLATRAVLHGALNAFTSADRGGKWSAGFYSGSVGTFLEAKLNIGSGYHANVAKNAIISGTVSSLTGGKFANGAIMGAFRYMFNDALHETRKATYLKDELCFKEARERYLHGDGSPVSVDASSVDLSKVQISDFKYIGHERLIQLFYHGKEYTNHNDALVYGGITVVYAGGDQVAILRDQYNFEQHAGSKDTFHNIATFLGAMAHVDITEPNVHSFYIYFRGTTTIGGGK